MTTLTSDDCIEQLTQNQPPHNQHAFRETLRTIVRLAKSEGRIEAIEAGREALRAMSDRSLH